MSGAKVTLSPDVRSAFTGASGAVKAPATVRKQRKKRPAPFSMRFTDEERARLDYERGVLSLAAHIRLKLFTAPNKQSAERKRLARKRFSPSADLTALSHMLGGLGQSRLASNLNQIAKAANMGALPVSPELEEELFEACAEIRAMRVDLIKALGVKSP